MVDTEQFSLRWNNFYSNLKTGIQDLLLEENFVDVTLAAEGRFLQAHKLLLSVCSPYFKALFRANPCKHPIVILNNVGFRELRDILTFIYRGEVHVSQTDLPGFLKTAELLQVKGLSGDDPDDVSSDPTEIRHEQAFKADAPTAADGPEEPADPRRSDAPERSKRPRRDDDSNDDAPSSYPIADVRKIKREPSFEIKRKAPVKHRPKEDAKPKNASSRRNSNERVWSADDDATYESKEWANDVGPNVDAPDTDDRLVEDVDVSASNVFSTPGSYSSDVSKDNGVSTYVKVEETRVLFECPLCRKQFVNRYNLKVHVRDKHDPGTASDLTCTICSRIMKNQSCLRVHMYQHRKQSLGIDGNR